MELRTHLSRGKIFRSGSHSYSQSDQRDTYEARGVVEAVVVNWATKRCLSGPCPCQRWHHSERAASCPGQGKEESVCDGAAELILTEAHHRVWTAVHETSGRRSWVDEACVGRRKEREQGGCEPTRFHLKRKTAWVGDMPAADIEQNTAVQRRQRRHCVYFLRRITCRYILSTS